MVSGLTEAVTHVVDRDTVVELVQDLLPLGLQAHDRLAVVDILLTAAGSRNTPVTVSIRSARSS